MASWQTYPALVQRALTLLAVFGRCGQTLRLALARGSRSRCYVSCRLRRDRSRRASPSQTFAKTLPRLGRTSRPLILATSFANALADFNFEPLLLVITQQQLDWTAGRGLELARFRDQFPFPLAPKFWGSWNDSWLKTDSLAYDAYVVRGSSSFEPF
jgi:hypothetical protein